MAISRPLFDDFSDAYEALIDWPKRLGHEGPFFRQWFRQADVQAVIDVACGTGHHAAMFHAWGLRVEGADLAENMIGRARRSFGESPGLRWVVRGFDQPIVAQPPFDAAVCLGNSLALAPDAATASQAIGQMFAAIRPGGLVIVQLLNLWPLPDGPCLWQKCRRAALPQGESLLVKGVHRSGNTGYVELIVSLLGDPPQMQTDAARLLGLEADELANMARAAGATRIDFYGGYQGQPYDRGTSVDLVLVAQK